MMETWSITETCPTKQSTKAYEGAFAQGSAYLHIRGSLEEGLQAAPQNKTYMRMPANVTVEQAKENRSKCGTYIPGVTGNHPLLKEEVVNLPNPLCFAATFEGERYDLDQSTTQEYRRELNLKNGELTRQFLWHTKSGAVLECTYRRIVSQTNKNTIVQTIGYRILEGSGRLCLQSAIDTDVTTNGFNHFSSCEISSKNNALSVQLLTDNHDRVHIVSSVFSDNMEFHPLGNQLQAERILKTGDTVLVQKLSSFSTSRDDELFDTAQLQAQNNALAKDFGAVYAENTAYWDALWNVSDIEIVGDEKAQRSLRFCIYHLLRCARTDGRTAICAKGFAGEAYFGHFFWDSEVYLLPFYMHTLADVGGALVEFRHNTLAGAKTNAQQYGYPGAKYAWESSVTGIEQCPNWQYADHEVHVTADVVYGLWYHYQHTLDSDFLMQGMPVLIETTRYWLARVYPLQGGKFALNGVMGPDEYTCFSNNNAYTNYMVRYSLQCTLQACALLKESYPNLLSEYSITPEWLQRVQAVAESLVFEIEPNGYIPQCDRFDALEEPDFEISWPDRSQPYGGVVSQEKLYRTKALKQADVLMLPYLFPSEFTDEQVLQNYTQYLPYNTHDSSLSAVVHSILCCRLKRKEEAWHFFEKAMDIDLDFEKGGAAEGIHIANCGGIWQAVVLGFAGLQQGTPDGKPTFTPHLPAHWQSVTLRLNRGGTPHTITLTRDENKVGN